MLLNDWNDLNELEVLSCVSNIGNLGGGFRIYQQLQIVQADEDLARGMAIYSLTSAMNHDAAANCVLAYWDLEQLR